RKTVTILFTDIVDSTSLGATLDPEVLQDVLQRFFGTVERVVRTHGGTVEKFIGDAVMAAFGIPTLHEDDALRAVRAANDLHETLAALNAELERERGVTIQIRTGLNTGEVVAGDPGSGQSFATGTAVNVAMRIHQSAAPGEIVLGEATHRLVSHAIDSEPVAPVDLGAVLGQVKTFRLVGVGEAVRPLGAASLVGRSEQLAWLHAAFAGVQAERRSRVVTVLGDAGVGKSRLVSEFIGSLGGEARALVGRCVSYGEGATYLPLAEIVRQAVPERPRAAIAAMLADDDQAGLIAERVTELTGQAEGAASTGEVFWAVRRFLEALALEHPLVVVLEDIHWAESTLLDLVEYLDSWSAEAPLLLLCLARRELLDDRPGWGGVTDVLALDPLAEHDAGSLVSELAGDAFDATAQAKIVQVAEGNPLFLEQLLAFAEEAGTEALAAVPPTVEALLAGRLGRLDPAERVLLERAAVVGRDFARSALIALSPPEDLVALDSLLARVGRRGLIRSVRGRDDDAYRFHHVLIRDVAYSGVTKQTRADVHERYGTWLEQRDGPDEIVGHHFERAHDYAAELRPSDPKVLELAEWAGQRLGAAGLAAFKRADTPATINLLGRAAALLPPDHEERVSFLSELGLARWWGGDKIGAESALSDAASHAAEQRDEPARLRAEMELGYLRLFTDRAADPARLLTLTDRATDVFEMEDDERALGRAWKIAGHVRGSMGGQCGEWVQAAERARTYYRRAGWSPAACLLDLAAGLFHGPTPVHEGIARCEALLAEGTDRIGRAHILVYLGGLHGLVDQSEQALELLAEAQQVYRELDDAYALAANGGRVEGRVHVLSADLGTAEQVLRDCAERLQRLGDEAGFSSLASELGQVLYAQGRYADAGEWGELAEAHAPRGDIIAQFAWRTLRAKTLAQGGRPDEADTLVREALSIVERTDLLTHHGEVCVDAAHVAWLQDRHDQAAEQGKRALELFDAKDNTASADRARAVLDVIAA
ncbi:MAG: AAA family ATPase, partial [Actinomycetota bacterium]|nr:AAA family ATPase [Actinomycetota bacterium]